MSPLERQFMLDCFYLWVEERATVFCPICASEPEMGDDCLCGEVAA